MAVTSVAEAPLVQLVYTSGAVNEMTEPELDALLVQSREKNARLGITGLLLYKSGLFIQVLEGSEREVRSLYATIESDVRHRGVTLIFCRPAAKREFPQWRMGFRRLEMNEPLPTGFTNLLGDLQEFRKLSAGKMGQLVQIFAESIR